jgi:hypothetical protein
MENAGWVGRIRGPNVLIGSMRVSKADGSQTLDLQRDALLAAGVELGGSMRIWPPGAMTPAPGSRPASRRSSPATPWWCGSSTGSDVTSSTW